MYRNTDVNWKLSVLPLFSCAWLVEMSFAAKDQRQNRSNSPPATPFLLDLLYADWAWTVRQRVWILWRDKIKLLSTNSIKFPIHSPSCTPASSVSPAPVCKTRHRCNVANKRMSHKMGIRILLPETVPPPLTLSFGSASLTCSQSTPTECPVSVALCRWACGIRWPPGRTFDPWLNSK